MRICTYIVLIVLLLLGVSFAVLNSEPVVINFYFAKHSLALSLLLVLSFGIGCLLGIIVTSFFLVKQKARNVKLKSRVKLAEEELANLRTIPLKDNR